MILCSDLRKFAPSLPDCCGSCHYEAEDGYSEMCEIGEDELRDGGDWMKTVGYACCAVSIALGGLADKREVLKKASRAAEGEE